MWKTKKKSPEVEHKDIGQENKVGAKLDQMNAEIKTKVSIFSTWFFGVTKFIFGLFLLPFVYSVTVSFLNEFNVVDQLNRDYFWAGLITLLVIYLFVWELGKIYNLGHKILEVMFSYVQPLVKVAPYLLPIYTIVLCIVYAIVSRVNESPAILNYFMFLFSFTMGLHLIFSAKTIRGKKKDFLKGNYIFGFSFVYILNIFVLGFILNIIFSEYSFVNLFNMTFQTAKGIFAGVYNQLFLSPVK
ncbi:MAG: hypothetical protein ABIH18_05645 [Candidatus Omnitrophota bacterium]